MSRAEVLCLIGATVAFDALMIWLIGFTLAWAGLAPWNTVGFWVMVAAPIVATGYTIAKVIALRRERHPPL